MHSKEEGRARGEQYITMILTREFGVCFCLFVCLFVCHFYRAFLLIGRTFGVEQDFIIQLSPRAKVFFFGGRGATTGNTSALQARAIYDTSLTQLFGCYHLYLNGRFICVKMNGPLRWRPSRNNRQPCIQFVLL